MNDRNSRLRIIVLGYIVRGPLGGMAWHHLQYVIGLARLGHDVYFFEDSDDYASCYDPQRNVMDIDPAYGIRFARDAFNRVGIPDRWAYFDVHTSNWLGPAANRAHDLGRSADMLLNLSGVNPLREWTESIPVRVLVDTDPAFTQIRHLTNASARAAARRHTAFLSFGENIGQPGCTVPDDGFPWQPTRQPVVLDAWPVKPPRSDGNFSTVMQWDSYPARDFGGQTFGMKSASFEPYLALPAMTSQPLLLALGSAHAPRDALRLRGWNIVDSRQPTLDPWTYQQFIQESKAEFSVAKHGYVISRCGWFSERSTSYLASGRPVLVQETGFSKWMDTGCGVVAFDSPAEALDGIAEINSNYEAHCSAAREMISAYFDAGKVLARLIADSMQPVRPPTNIQHE